MYRIESIQRNNYDLDYRLILPVNGFSITLKNEDITNLEILAYQISKYFWSCVQSK